MCVYLTTLKWIASLLETLFKNTNTQRAFTQHPNKTCRVCLAARSTIAFIIMKSIEYIHKTHVHCICTYMYNTYITVQTNPTPPSLPLRMGFAIQFSWLLFLFGQLNRLWLCVCTCIVSLYTIWYFYKLQIHTHILPRVSKRNHTFPLGVGLLHVALAFSICAL